jgi:WD40 repeat protein
MSATARSVVAAAIGSLVMFSCSGSDDNAAGGANDVPVDGGGRAGSSAGKGGKDASAGHGGATGGAAGADASLGNGGAGGSSSPGGASTGGQVDLDVGIEPTDAGPTPLTVCRDLAIGSAMRVQFDAAADKLLLVRDSGPTVVSMNPWKSVVTFGGHRSWVVDAALSPDGKRGASVGDDGMLREWDAVTGAEVASVFLEPPIDPESGHSDARNPWRVAFIGNDGVVVTRSAALRAYDWARLTPRWSVVNAGDLVTSMASSPDGQTVAVATPFEVALYRSGDGKELARSRTPLEASVIPYVYLGSIGPFVAFSPEGSRLVWAASSLIRVLDPNASLADIGAATVQPQVIAFAVGPNADWIAVSSSYDLPGTVRQIRINDGSTLHSFPNAARSIAVSSDGRLIAAATPGPVVWDTNGNTVVQKYDQIASGLSADPPPIFSRKQPVIAFSDQLWNLDGTELMRPIASSSREMGFDPGGDVLVEAIPVVGSPTGSYYSVGSSTPTRTVAFATGAGEGLTSPSLSPDGSTLAAQSPGGGQLRLWSTSTGAVVHEFSAYSQYVDVITWSTDGSLLATTGADALADAGPSFSVKIWRSADATLASTIPANVRVSSIAFSPDGKTLVSADDRGRVALWSAPAGTLIRELAPAVPIGTPKAHFNGSVAFSSNGAFVASRGLDMFHAFDSFIAILRVSDGNEVMRFRSFSDANMGQIAWSPDDRIIASSYGMGLRLFCVPPMPAP